MTYLFVTAKYFTTNGMKEPRAIVIHMAEGGGTVNWLTHPTNDNSVHFVVEYSGRVVQMVREQDADHSLHWDTAHWSASTCGGTFSAAAAKALLGDGASDPNAYLFGVECEGYAGTPPSDADSRAAKTGGPNPAQTAALTALVEDLRSRHPTLHGLLGHRDFQGYKACPGCHVFDKLPHGPWPAVGSITEEPMGVNLDLDATHDPSPLDAFGTASIVGTGHYALRVSDGAATKIADGTSLGVVQKAKVVDAFGSSFAAGEAAVAYNLGGALHVSPVRDIGTTFKPLPLPAPVIPDVQHTVTLAVDGQEKAKVLV